MNYTLRDIPPDLWHKFKVRCAMEGVPMRGKILELIDEWLIEQDRIRRALQCSEEK